MEVREAPTPLDELFRIARGSPFAWPAWEYIGGNRFDDPQNRYRVLYLAGERRTCFLETLAALRPKTAYLAKLREMPDGDRANDVIEGGFVARDWYLTRHIGRVRLIGHQRWLDFRSLETRETLRRELAPELLRHGFEDLDAGDALTRNYALTQIVSRWAYEQAFQGIAYTSRFDTSHTCWAVFEGATVDPVGSDPISIDDQDLLAVAHLFGLTIER